MATKACVKAQTQIPTLPAQAIISQVRTEKASELHSPDQPSNSIADVTECLRIVFLKSLSKIFFNVHHSSPAALPVTVRKQGLF